MTRRMRSGRAVWMGIASALPSLLVASSPAAANGSDWYFQGTVDQRWTYRFVDQLKRIPASAFVAVDERASRVGSGSAAFAYGPGCPAPSSGP